jgi:16S rRNA (guanine966-N2)-methyltransferase
LRVIGGRLRGRRVEAPKSDSVRPTYDRVRESVFAILEPVLPSARVLDLFAGSGVLGIEALSRGAASVTFVERDRRTLELAETNVERLGLSRESRLVRGDAFRLLAGGLPGGPFDLVFIDPPYGSGMAARALALLGDGDDVTAGARIVVEHARGDALGESYSGLRCIRREAYGGTEVAFFEAGGGRDPRREEE